MRVTHKSIYNTFTRSLDEIQGRRVKADIQLSTGKEIVNLEDKPADVVDIKRFGAKIDQNENYQGILAETMREMYAVDENLKNISDNMIKVREIGIESLQLSVQQNLPVLAGYIKGYLQDIVKSANSDFNGHTLFSGTKTRDYSLNKTPEAQNNDPYEIVQGTATVDNPSGLKVVFKGNNEDRIINKDDKTTEIVNVKPSEVFGAGGTKIFEDIIKLYNKLQYKDGVVRQKENFITKEDSSDIDVLQKNLADNFDEINRISAKVGTRINRLDAINSQMQEEKTRMMDFRSSKEDVNMAEVAMDLKREETLLNYTLQVGSRISQNTLFDYLK